MDTPPKFSVFFPNKQNQERWRQIAFYPMTNMLAYFSQNHFRAIYSNKRPGQNNESAFECKQLYKRWKYALQKLTRLKHQEVPESTRQLEEIK